MNDAGSTALEGAVYVVNGPFTGTANLRMADAILRGVLPYDRAGGDVEACDIDADGHADLLIGVGGAEDAGAAFLVYGPVSGVSDLSTFDGVFAGEAWNDFAGYGLAAGDVDGDGRTDILVGAPEEDSGGSDAGAAYLLLNEGL